MTENIPVMITIDSAVDRHTAKLANMLLEALLREKKLRNIVEFIGLGAKAKYNNEAKKEWVDRYAKVYGDGTCLRQADIYNACDQALAETADQTSLTDELIQMAKDMEWQPIESAPKGKRSKGIRFLIKNNKGFVSICSQWEQPWNSRYFCEYSDATIGLVNYDAWRPIKSLDDYPLVKAFLGGV